MMPICATPEEWAEFKAMLPKDARERFILIMQAARLLFAQENKEKEL